jgi:hypothetical protein
MPYSPLSSLAILQETVADMSMYPVSPSTDFCFNLDDLDFKKIDEAAAPQ